MNAKVPRLVSLYDIATKKLQQGKGAPVKLRFILASFMAQGRYQRYALLEQWVRRKSTPAKDRAILQEFLDGKMGDDADEALEVEGKAINRKVIEFKSDTAAGRLKDIKLVEEDGEPAVAWSDEKAAEALAPPVESQAKDCVPSKELDSRVAFVIENWPKEIDIAAKEKLAIRLWELRDEHGRRFKFLCKDAGGPLPCGLEAAKLLIAWHRANLAVRQKLNESGFRYHDTENPTFAFIDPHAGRAVLGHINRNRDIGPLLESGELHPEIERQDAMNLFSKPKPAPKRFVDDLRKCLERQPKEHWHQCIADGIGFLQGMQAEASA